MTAFDQMLDALYADLNLGVDVIWTPAGGDPIPLRALPMLGDVTAQLQGFTAGLVAPSRSIKVRMSEVSAAAPDLRPQKGDRIDFAGDPFKIQGAPRREDPRRLEWTFDLSEA